MTSLIDVTAPLEQEGTKAIVKGWYVKPGEAVAAGDPLVELETDKVAVEVPSPTSGVLREVLVDVDGEAEPGAVLGRLAEGADAATDDASGDEHTTTAAGAPEASVAYDPQPADAASLNGEREHRLSPSVRRLVREHNLDPAAISGTGKRGRLTKSDVRSFIDSGGAARAAGAAAAHARGPGAPAGIQHIPHDSMRRRIADHMQHSVQTAPHVTAVFEADFSAIIAHRRANKEPFAAQGVNLTFMAYIVAACVDAMKAAPTVNSRWRDDHLEVFEDINVGVGVALGDKGLIVPVIAQAQTKSLFGVARDLDGLTRKARDGKLAPEDVRGGTFSISNHGASGSLVAAPIIINQPQSAILGVGKLEKRVVVREIDGADAMVIKPMAYVSLTIDHRVLDGAQTNAWLTRFVDALEGWRAD